jgi:ELWxxDGT repeat protein
VLVKNAPGINPAVGAGSFPSDLTAVNGTLYFSADDGTNGPELWKSDGTNLGTVPVKDAPGINPLAGAGSGPNNLTAVGNTLFFSANDGTNGVELWKSDGTNAGTVLVQDIFPTGSSFPSGLILLGHRLFFAANDGAAGDELWSLFPAFNRPPSGAAASFTTTAPAAVSGTLTGTDPDGDRLTFSIVTNGALGSAVITNAATGAFTYTPNPGGGGPDTFTYKVNDGIADSAIAAVSVTITLNVVALPAVQVNAVLEQ